MLLYGTERKPNLFFLSPIASARFRRSNPSLFDVYGDLVSPSFDDSCVLTNIDFGGLRVSQTLCVDSALDFSSALCKPNAIV